ncbi:hypothetical protein IAR55_000630 [Kwoniella newhampshirensis]|uniref:JmjC domain-containing protein n=1 Tax=Kwoniella newhampshirensis TaxID=1651941 RepID=A0AAW0Z7Y0_9TREE
MPNAPQHSEATDKLHDQPPAKPLSPKEASSKSIIVPAFTSSPKPVNSPLGLPSASPSAPGPEKAPSTPPSRQAQDLELAPLPQTFDPDQEPPLPSPVDQIVVDPFGVGNQADDTDDLRVIDEPLLNEARGGGDQGGEKLEETGGEVEEDGEDQTKMMEYITSLQQFEGDADGDVEDADEVEMADQVVVAVEGAEQAMCDDEETAAAESKFTEDTEGTKTSIGTTKVDEFEKGPKETEAHLNRFKDVDMPTAPSSPLTPVSDLPDLPDTLSLSPVIEVTLLPSPLTPALELSQTKKDSAIPHAESSADAARRNSSSPRPAQKEDTSRKAGVKRPRETNGAASRGKGKSKSVEVIEVENDLRSIPDQEELQEVKPDEKNEDFNGKRKAKKAKGHDGKAVKVSGQSRKRHDAALGISRGGDKPPEKIAPRPKAVKDVDVKKMLQGKTREIQMAPCQRPRYAKWGKCTQCIAKVGGDSCRFRDYRVFSIDPVTTEITGPGWFESTDWKDEMTPLPTDFNVPLTEKHIKATERTVAPMLLPLITREVRHVINNKAIKRGVDTAKHRALCDFCSSTIFGGWFFCKRCGRDFCLHCERYFPDSLETMSTSPWPLPDAARPRLLRCHHPPSTNPSAPQPKGPAFHTRSDLQPVSRFGDEELRDHWLALAEFVLEGKEEMRETLKLMGLVGDDEAEKVMQDWRERSPTLAEKKVQEEDDNDAEKPQPSTPEASKNDSAELEDGQQRLYEPLPPSIESETVASSEKADSGNSSDTSRPVQDQPFRYTKSTLPTAVPIPDPAGLEDHSMEFMFVPNDSLDNSTFDRMWGQGEPIVVDDVGKQFNLDWTPDTFIDKFGKEACYVMDCQTNVPQPMTVAKFFELFKKAELRGKAILKLKDWPSTDDFQNTHPELYNDFCDALPVPDYTRREGVLNLYSHFPPGPTKPDIGPKMYNAFAAVEAAGGFGSTRLHMDVADAINVMLYASPRGPTNSASTPSLQSSKEPIKEPSQAIVEENNDESHTRAPGAKQEPGCAVWDLFRAEDSDQIREFLKEKFDQTHKFTDPIHSQLFYLDASLRKELWEKKGVVSWRVYQYPGQAVFIPAGCAHQVCNLADCIKIALDFVSPHNVRRCQTLTQDFRKENFVKAWKEDVLQLYNVLWYAWQSCRETQVRRKQEQEAQEAAQAARAAHLASLRSGDHETYGHGRYSPVTTPALGIGMGLGGWNVSSVRDEPHAGSRSPSVSRGGSPGPGQSVTLARVLAESRSGSSQGSVTNGKADRQQDHDSEAVSLGGKDEDKPKDERTTTLISHEKTVDPKHYLTRALLDITLRRDETDPREWFVPSTALWGSARKVNLPGAAPRDVKPTPIAAPRTLSARQKEVEKREKERLDRKARHPARPLRTSTLIKLGARRVDEILGMAMGEMGSGDGIAMGGGLGGLASPVFARDDAVNFNDNEAMDIGSPMTGIVSFGGNDDATEHDQVHVGEERMIIDEEEGEPAEIQAMQSIDMTGEQEAEEEEDEEEARAALVVHLGELAKTAPDDDDGDNQVDMGMFV